MNSFFQLSVSIFCIVGTIFMITLFVWAIMIQIQISKLINKLEEISEIAKDTANDAKSFIDRTIKSLETFKNSLFTFEFFRKIAMEVIDIVKNNAKGAKNGQEK